MRLIALAFSALVLCGCKALPSRKAETFKDNLAACTDCYNSYSKQFIQNRIQSPEQIHAAEESWFNYRSTFRDAFLAADQTPSTETGKVVRKVCSYQLTPSRIIAASCPLHPESVVR